MAFECLVSGFPYMWVGYLMETCLFYCTLYWTIGKGSSWLTWSIWDKNWISPTKPNEVVWSAINAPTSFDSVLLSHWGWSEWSLGFSEYKLQHMAVWGIYQQVFPFHLKLEIVTIRTFSFIQLVNGPKGSLDYSGWTPRV
jgi:hypothetical protein